MEYTWERGYRTVLKRCSNWERHLVMYCERQARRSVVEEEAYRQCMASPIGITDCSNIRVSRTSVRWLRRRGETWVAIGCLLQPNGTWVWKGYKARQPGRARRQA